MEEPPIPTSVTFSLAPGDMLAYNQTVISRVPWFQVIVWARRIIVPVCALLIGLSLDLGWIRSLGLCAMVTAVWIPVTQWLFAVRVRRASRSSPGLLQEQTIGISDSHLRQTTAIADSTVDWRKIQDVMVSQSQVLFLFDRRYALIVPVTAFAYPSQAKAFAEMARRWWAEANGKTVTGSEMHG